MIGAEHMHVFVCWLPIDRTDGVILPEPQEVIFRHNTLTIS